jgi:hypothetical protein
MRLKHGHSVCRTSESYPYRSVAREGPFRGCVYCPHPYVCRQDVAISSLGVAGGALARFLVASACPETLIVARMRRHTASRAVSVEGASEQRLQWRGWGFVYDCARKC